jgi:hypothetical protein
MLYIGVCDCCENKHMQEVTPSLYAFVKEQDAINERKTFWWVAFIFFFIYGEFRTINSFWYTMK